MEDTVLISQTEGGGPAEASQTWEQRGHSEAAARETGGNVEPAWDPDPCYDLEHNLFKVWSAPPVNNHSQGIKFQQLQGECVDESYLKALLRQ